MLNFLNETHDISKSLASSYDPYLVTLSIVVATLASFSALQISERIHNKSNKKNYFIWIITGAFVMGLGIFSMHFIGMLAFKLSVPINYELKMTLISIIPAILASGAAIHYLSYVKINFLKLNVGGFLIGVGIGSMHYIGMMAMKVNAKMYFDIKYFILSILIAHVLATLALTIKFFFSGKDLLTNYFFHFIAAIVMGCSIAGMHYTGMAAAYYFPIESLDLNIIAINKNLMSYFIFAINFFILSLTITSAIVDRYINKILQADQMVKAYATFPDKNPGPIFKINCSGKVILANHLAQNLFPKLDIYKNSIHNSIPELQDVCKRMHHDEELSVKLEVKIQEKIYLLQCVKIPNQHEINIYGTDISDIKQLEKEMLDQKRSLDIAALVSETDLKGNITYVNDKFCEVSQYSREELIGQKHSIVNSGTHSKLFWKDMWKKMTSGIVWTSEICNRAKDGSLYWVESTFIPVYDDEGKIRKYSSVRIDITEKKESEKLLSHTEKLASIGELAAGVGHEINNPLAIVLGNLQKLKKELKKDQLDSNQLKIAIKNQEEGIERIATIVDSLRTYARMDTEYNQTLNVHQLIEKTNSLVGSMYEKEGIYIDLELNASEYYIKGNIGKFQQVLMILLSNAKDAIANLSSPKIKIITESNNSIITVKVIDNGVGIPDNIKDKIFESFFTTKDLGKGTGIGLGVLAKIVFDMKGKINLDSKLTVGSTFILSFPLTKDEFVEENFVPTKEVENEFRLNGSVLIVDDEEGIRELLVDILEDMGLKVDSAESGEKALALVKHNFYDYICTDMKMPKMTGDQFIEESKKLPNGKTNYFIITGGVTTNFSKERRASLREIADGYIKKPFTEESIYEVLYRYNKKD